MPALQPVQRAGLELVCNPSSESKIKQQAASWEWWLCAGNVARALSTRFRVVLQHVALKRL